MTARVVLVLNTFALL